MAFYLTADRDLARGWTARARDNIAAIQFAKELENSGRAPSEDEQRRLLRFMGFGATDAGNEAPGASATFGVETARRAVTERSRST